MTDDTDEVTHDFPLPLAELAPSSEQWSHDQALSWAHVATDPKLYDPQHAATIKLAWAFIRLSQQHRRLAHRVDQLKLSPEDIETLAAATAKRGFAEQYPQTCAALVRLLTKQRED